LMAIHTVSTRKQGHYRALIGSYGHAYLHYITKTAIGA